MCASFCLLFNRPIARLSRFASPLVLSITALLAAGCGGNGPAFSGNTAVTLLASSTANDELSVLSLYITGIALTSKAGKTVTLLATPQAIEFIHLNGGVEPLLTVSIPQDVYTSATVSAKYGTTECETFQSSDPTEVSSYGDIGTDAAAVTVNLPQPITVTGTGMGLDLNLLVSQTTNYTSCPGIFTGPFSLTPTFDLTPVAFASQPTNVTNGMATGLRGLIESVTAAGASFSVAGDFGAGASGPTWQVSSNASTLFQGVSRASQLAAGMPVEMDVAIQSDGTLAATRIAVYDANPANVSFSTGQLIYFGSRLPAVPTQGLSMAEQSQGPDFAGLGGGAIPYNFANAAFQISGQLANLSALPFTASFNASNMVPGQNVFATTHLVTQSLPYPGSTVTLLPQSIDGTVSAISSSGSFTIYTVSLAPYNLFPALAPLQGQVNSLSDPGSMVVYADSNTQMLNKPAAGSVARFYGLVFNDNGTLRMDCAQVSDGVPE